MEVQQEVQLEVNLISDKIGRLDIVANLRDGTKINIEMQVKDNQDTPERSLFYTTGQYHESLRKNDNYLQIPRVIGIWILNFDEFEQGPFHEIARLKRDYQNIVLTDIRYIQLPKFREKCKKISNKLEEWLTFINNVNSEEIDMIENEYVKKAKEEIEKL